MIWGTLIIITVLAAMAWAVVTLSRPFALAAYLVGIVVVAAAITMVSGRPSIFKPSVGHYVVLGFKVDEHEGIYALLEKDGELPRYYLLPWDKDLAEGAQMIIDDAGGKFIPGSMELDVQPNSMQMQPFGGIKRELPGKPIPEAPMVVQ